MLKRECRWDALPTFSYRPLSPYAYYGPVVPWPVPRQSYAVGQRSAFQLQRTLSTDQVLRGNQICLDRGDIYVKLHCLS